MNSQSWQLGLSHSCLQSRHCELPSPFRDSLMPARDPQTKPPAPWASTQRLQCWTGRPCTPCPALAVPQAAWSLSGGSMGVGVLEDDQVEKCGTRWWVTAASGRAVPTLSLGAGCWQLNTFCDNSISCEKSTTALGYCADYCLPLQGVCHFPSSLGETHYPPLPHSDPILLSMVMSFCRSLPAHLLNWHGSVPPLLFFVFVFFWARKC